MFSPILPIGVFRGQLDWSSSVSTSWRLMTWILWGDVFPHGKMKANLAASLVGFTTRKNGWDFFSGWKWWLMGKGVLFCLQIWRKKQIWCLRVGVLWRQTKNNSTLSFNFAKLLLPIFSCFFWLKTFFYKTLGVSFCRSSGPKIFPTMPRPGRRGGLRSRLLVASAVVLGTFLAREIAFLGFPRQDFYRENHRFWKKWRCVIMWLNV